MVREETRSYWDGRADSFNCTGNKTGSYSKMFLELADIQPGSHVFDMGCGPGTLAVPLGLAGCTVEACDFSPRMIELLEAHVAKCEIPVHTHLLAWEDDWEAKGIEPGCCDVAITSRSIQTEKIGWCLEKLETVTTGRAMATVANGPIPDVDPHLMNALGRLIPDTNPRKIAVESLRRRGREPEVSFIAFERQRTFTDFDYALDELAALAGPDPLTNAEMELVREYAREHFVRKDGPGGPTWRLDYSLTVLWSLIIWSV